MWAVVIVSAFEITGTTVVFPCRARRTCRSRSSSKPPRTRAFGAYLPFVPLPFVIPFVGAIFFAAAARF